jgi:Mrp family chromosome partitioning ATPase
LAVLRSASTADRSSVLGQHQKPVLLEPPQWFLSHLSVSASAQASNLIAIKFTGPTPAIALAGANTVVAAYRDLVRTSVASEASALLAQLPPTSPDPLLASRRAGLAAEAQNPIDGVRLSFPPTHASKHSYAVLAIVVASAIGLLGGIGLAYERARRRPIFTDSYEPEIVLGAPLLIEVPEFRPLRRRRTGPVLNGSSSLSEPLLIAIRLVLDRRDTTRRGMSVAIVSAGRTTARSRVTANMALALANDGMRTLVVDGDNSRGLTRQLLGGRDGPSRAQAGDSSTDVQDDAIPPVRFNGLPIRMVARNHGQSMTEMPGSTLEIGTELVSGMPPRSLPGLLRELEDSFDVVLVDTPPFLQSARATVLTAAAHNVLVVVNHRGSVRQTVELARRLRLMGAVPVGYIYLGVRRPRRLWRLARRGAA